MPSLQSRLPSLIGVIHLPPLPGAPGAAGEITSDILQRAGSFAVREAMTLVKAGFQGVVIENFGDVPFYKECVPPETVASLAVIAAAVRESVKASVGINVLRNDGRSALAVAACAGCDFIRVNVLSGVAASDQGLLEGRAAELLRERERLGAREVAIFADAQVKHARSLSSDDIVLSVEEQAHRALADAVVVTGATTGRPVDRELLLRASRAARAQRIPLYVGSGATPETLGELASLADGVIVGSAIRRGGKAGAPLDAARVKAFSRAWARASRAARGRKAR